jgi:uroporphyrinogen-III decarboxylase
MCVAFKEAKPDIILVYHGCGNATQIFGDLIECGIDAYHSLEVKAGIDVVELKKKYHNKLAYIGNMDCRDILTGPPDGIKRDLLRRLNAAKGGGYIPSADHSVPHSVSVKNYEYFLGLIREYGKYPLSLGEFDIPEMNGV